MRSPVMKNHPVQELHQNIPAFRQALYGKDKSYYVPTNMSKAKQKQALVEQLSAYKNPTEYLKFVRDIRVYDFKQSVSISLLSRLSEIDLEEVLEDFRSFSFVYYDILGSDILVYLVQWKDKKYLCLYRFSRYFQTSQHPRSKLLYCVPYK